MTQGPGGAAPAGGGPAGGAGGGQDLLVSAFGVVGNYAGVSKIVAIAEDGNDIIDIAADVTVPVEIKGGIGRTPSSRPTDEVNGLR